VERSSYSTLPSGFTSLGASAQAMKIGVNRDASAYTGSKIDEVRVYNRALNYPELTTVATVGAAESLSSAQHCYRLRAVKSDAYSACTAWPTDWTAAACLGMSETIHLDATATSPFAVRLDWNNVPNDNVGFEIEKKLVNGTFTNIATVGGNVLTYNDKLGINPLKPYTYRVRKSSKAIQTLFTEDFSTGLHPAVWFVESGHAWRNDTLTTPTSTSPYTI